MTPPLRRLAGILILLTGWMLTAYAHQDPCHRWHSCPSDRGTYVCGDRGRCDHCPDNHYCLNRKPRAVTPQTAPPAPPATRPDETVVVTRVIDGDTLELSIKEKVLLIGVDTPETKHPRKPVEAFGREATAFTKRMVEGKEVRLAYDQQRRDRYNRLLAYVYLPDGTFLNAEIIRQGYGFAYTRFPFQYLEAFRALEREAREAKRGLWGR